MNNVVLALAIAALSLALGWQTLLLVHAPVLLLSGAAGVWLFYVQHQFERAYWARGDAWSIERSAVAGSSFYDLPAILRWFSAFLEGRTRARGSMRRPRPTISRARCWPRLA